MLKKEQSEEEIKDLLWADGEQYSEREEIKALKDLILRLFHEPYFGEKRNVVNLLKVREGQKKDSITQYSDFEKYFGHEEILIDGYKINKYSLWTIK